MHFHSDDTNILVHLFKIEMNDIIHSPLSFFTFHYLLAIFPHKYISTSFLFLNSCWYFANSNNTARNALYIYVCLLV